LLINLVGEIEAIGRRRNETAFAVDTDRNHDTGARFLDAASARGNDAVVSNGKRRPNTEVGVWHNLVHAGS
jgi:hypothetical protein